MFIKIERKKSFYEYEVKDDKNLLLHYFDKELQNLNLQAPLIMYIHVNRDDRKGYRIKLVKLLKKIIKLQGFDVYLMDTPNIEKIKNETSSFII